MMTNVSGTGNVNTDYSVRYLRCRRCGRLLAAFPGKGKVSHGLCIKCYNSCGMNKKKRG